MAKTAKTKASSKKQQSRGVDFKKIKRKLGRKLPPPKNETNTEIKSKAIILPEQSVASEKAGLAVSKKGLTLKELLQQTSHHNAKVRKDALMGLKDLLQKFPDEMKLHKYAIIEKLRERISDDDKLVRESLYQLFKMVILPSIQEDNQGPLVSLMMAYIFSAMKHLSIDVRLMAFKFFDLAVQYYPPTFHSNAEKILQNYKDILQKNQFYIQEKGKLKNALAGLVHCLSLLSSTEKEINEQLVPDQEVLHAFEPEMPTEFTDFPLVISKLGDLVPVLVNCFQDFIPLINGMSTLDAQSFDCMFSILESIDLAVRFFINGDHKNKFEFHQHHLGDHEVIKWDQHIIPILLKKLLRIYPLNSENKFSEKDDEKYFMLNIVFTEIFLHLNGWISPTELLERSLAFIEYAMLEKACSGARFHNVFREKQILRLIPFIPKLLAQLSGDWKSRILQAFTKTFLECKPDLQLKLACLTAIEEMLIISKDYNGTDSELVAHQISWMKELPVLLLLLGDKHPSSSQVVLNLVVRLGQRYLTNSSFEAEFDNMQYLLQEFYSSYREGEITYGAFLRLPRECQELSLCCLYYFSHLDLPLLKSIVSCCLCQELDEFILFRILEVLHSAFKAGHIRTSDYLSFLLTLICRLKVYSERKCTGDGNTRTRDNGTLKSLTSIVCKYLLQMGDDSVVFLTIERAINEQILLEPQLDNACSMLRVLVVLDSKPTRLSDQSIITMSNFLSRYLIDVMLCVPLPEDQKAETSTQVQRRSYYLVPCFFLFERSKKLLKLVLTTMGSTISEIIISLSCGDSNSHFSRDYLARINAIVSVILLISKESKLQETICPLKEEIVNISNNIYSLQSSEKLDVSIEERHRIRLTKDQLDTLTQSMPTT